MPVGHMMDDAGHHATWWWLPAEFRVHCDYLKGRGFTHVLIAYADAFSTGVTLQVGPDAGAGPIGDTTGSNFKLTPAYANWVRGLVDEAEAAGLKVMLQTISGNAAWIGASSDNGVLRTENATDCGDQFDLYFGDSPAVDYWLHGWDTNINRTWEDTIFGNITTEIKAGGQAAANKPYGYHSQPGGHVRYVTSSWLDFVGLQPGHGNSENGDNNAQKASYWTDVYADTNGKDIFVIEAHYAHLNEDGGVGFFGPAPSEGGMRKDAEGMRDNEVGTRLIGVCYGDWLRVVACDPADGLKFNDAAHDGLIAAVANTRLPGPNQYLGATNSIGNNGETQYLNVFGITGGGVFTGPGRLEWDNAPQSFANWQNLYGLDTDQAGRGAPPEPFGILPETGVDVRGRVSWAELETPGPTPSQLRGRVSHAEFEVPDVGTGTDVYTDVYEETF